MPQEEHHVVGAQPLIYIYPWAMIGTHHVQVHPGDPNMFMSDVRKRTPYTTSELPSTQEMVKRICVGKHHLYCRDG
jgi:hypothetical protein